MNYINITNFGNENIDRIASYMIMEEDRKREDIIHNAIYYLDRYHEPISIETLKECIEKAVIDAGEDPDIYITQELVNQIVKEFSEC